MNSKKFSLYRFVVIANCLMLFGVLLAKFGYRPIVIHSSLMIIAVILLSKRNGISLIVVVLLSLQIGVARGAQFHDADQTLDSLVGEKVFVQGRVVDDPVYSYKSQTEFHLGELHFESAKGELNGRIRVRSFEGANVQRGDVLKVQGKLAKGFGNRQGSVSFATLEPVSRSESVIEKIRSQFFAAVHTVLPDPQSSLGLGFVVGIRALLPEKLLDQLSITGLTHIVAVSGYNLTILIRLTRRLFAKRSKYQALMSSGLLMLTFVLITGATPSIMRASVVATFSLLGWANGRRMHPLVAILLGASITAFINPYYLWYDLGWYLSFLAFFGVLILAPVIKKRYFKDKLGFIGDTALESLSAQVMVIPLIAFVFEEVSLISLIANIVVVPLIPIAMLLTVLPVLVLPLSSVLAGWVAWPAKVVLTYITEIVAMFARLESAQIDFKLSSLEMVGLYCALGLLVSIIVKKHKISLNASRLLQ